MKRRIFVFVPLLCVALALVILAVSLLFRFGLEDREIVPSEIISSEEASSQPVSEPEEQSEPEQPEEFTSYGLSADYARLVLVNADHSLPQTYVPELAEIPSQYLNGQLSQIDKNVLPYLIQMIEDGKKDGVRLLVRSPYRSYDIQGMLFANQVQTEKNNGLSGEQAEKTAATVVARPGTSEHQTGLAVDLNSTSSVFEYSEEYKWMQQHGSDYGFILRYPLDKTELTGIIYEPWHYRFVGVKAAKEIEALGMCYEEYVAYKNIGDVEP